MGAAGLIEIKRRIKSVESTRKITKAMGLVATSKLRKARKELVANEQYNNLCKEVINEVVSSMPEDFDSIYYNRLIIHLRLAINRTVKGIYEENMLLEHIKEKLSNSFNISKLL
ncbi:MAG: F0F1 ATP synthase subunit gamma [Clostridium celatum]|nr:F0F1 ATP synthase subunit gamma [Clostridium celatum]